MKSVYVFGPIHLFGENYLEFYRRVNTLCGEYFDRVVGTYPDFWETNETPREFYDRTYETITKLDLFIGEVSSPSWGVGMEFQMAEEYDIPCIALCREGSETSSMIRGVPCLKQLIYYADVEDAVRKLEPILKDFASDE